MAIFVAALLGHSPALTGAASRLELGPSLCFARAGEQRGANEIVGLPAVTGFCQGHGCGRGNVARVDGGDARASDWHGIDKVGDVLRYSRASKENGIGKGEYARVVDIDARQNRVTVELNDRRLQSYDPRRQSGVSVYREEERAFSAGDRIQFTAPANDLKVANRELGTVEGITESRMAFRMDDGRSVQIDPVKHPHLDHGYAVTSHSSQGQTAERVLVHVDTDLGARDLLNNRMAYVAISRSVHGAQIFTNDREKLPGALGHEVSQQSAHVPDVAKEQAVEIAPKHEHSYGFGIGM